MNSFNRIFPLVGILAATAALVAGCGVDHTPDANLGKQLFTQKCGSCHTLEDAGTKGTQGPNLDDAFADSIDVGMDRSTAKSVVLKQIELPQGKEMPANLVKGDDAKAVAEYVSEVAAPGAKADNEVQP